MNIQDVHMLYKRQQNKDQLSAMINAFKGIYGGVIICKDAARAQHIQQVAGLNGVEVRVLTACSSKYNLTGIQGPVLIDGLALGELIKRYDSKQGGHSHYKDC